MKKKTRRKVLAFVLAFGMLMSTVFGTTPLGILADNSEANVEQTEPTEEITTEIPVETTESVSEEMTTEATVESTEEITAGVSTETTEEASENTTIEDITTEIPSDTAPEEIEDTAAEFSEKEEEAVVLPTYNNDGDSELSIDNSSYEIQIKDGDKWRTITNADEIYAGQELKLKFEWKLGDDNRTTTVFEIDKSVFGMIGLDISDSMVHTLYKGDTEVGSYQVVGNRVVITLTNDNFIHNTNSRVGGVDLTGKVSASNDVTEDGTKKNINFGSFSATPTFYLTNTESNASVSKSTVGSLTKNGASYQQTFEFTVKANNGTVTDITLQDVPSAGLSNPANVTVTESSVTDVATGSYTSLADALTAIQNATFYKDQAVKIQYTMDVDPAIYKEETSAYYNEISGTYVSNREEEPKNTNRSSASIQVNKPSISKEFGSYDASTGTVTWKISIDMKDYYVNGQEDLSLYLTNVKDIPVAGLSTGEADLDLAQFEHTAGTSIYTYEYTTTVTDTIKNSVVDEKVKNKVTMTTTDGNTYNSGEREGTITAQKATIAKEYTEYSREGDNLYVIWKVTISDLPNGIKDVTLTDTPTNWFNGGFPYQKHTGDVWVNDTQVITADSITDSDVVKSWTNNAQDQYAAMGTLVFQDDWIASRDSVTVKFKTLITEDTMGKIYKNTASLSYKDKSSDTTQNIGEVYDTFIDSSNLVTKTGKTVDGKNALAYKVSVAIGDLTLESGKNIVITDQLPEGLKLDTTSVQASISGQYWMTSGADGNLTISDTEDEAVFTISINDTLLSEIDNIKKNDPAVNLNIEYTAKLKDEVEFIKNGTTVTYENQASGTYDGQSIGSDSTTNQLTPVSIMDKSSTYSQDTAPYVKYTVTVNPDALTLLGADGVLTATDTIGAGLTFVDAENFSTADKKEQYRVKVYNTNTNEELVNALSAEYNISADKHTLNFTKLPDSTSLRIEYYAYAKPGSALTPENTTNSFQLSGIQSAVTNNAVQTSMMAYTPEGWADSLIGKITLFKFWTDGNQQFALDGSVFKLLKASYDETSKVITEGEVVQSNLAVGADGKIVIEDLDVNQLYVLYEIDSKTGYALNREPFYFVINGSTLISVPEGTKTFESTGADILKYENVKAGTLKITKTIEGDVTQAEAEGALEFKVTWKKNAAGDAKSIVVGTYKLNDGKFVYDTSTKTWTLTLDDLEPGEYEVEETVYDITGKPAASVKYSTDAGATWSSSADDAKDTTVQVSVQGEKTTALTYKNTYAKAKGSLTFTKEISGLDTTNAEAVWNQLSFTLSDGTKTIPIKKSAFMQNGDGTYTCTISDLDLDKNYSVTETNAELTGYKRTTTYQAGVDKVTAGSDTVAEVTLTAVNTTGKLAMKNEYTEKKGALTLKKTITGDLTDAAKKGGIKFRVTGPNGYDKTFTIDPNFTLKAGVYELELTDMALGDYTIVEENYEVSGYTCTISTKVGSATGSNATTTATVKEDETSTVEYTDDYTQDKGYITVSKKIDLGAGVESLDWDNDIKNTITFNIKNDEGTVVETITGADLTFNRTDAYVSAPIAVPVDDYYVVEVATHMTGISVSPTYTIDGTQDIGHNDSSSKITVTKDSSISVVCSNAYTSGTDLDISKQDITNQTELPGAKLTIYKIGTGGALTEVNSWESTTTKHTISLPAGEYRLVETTAPNGYTVAESIDFEVTAAGEVKINGTDVADKTVTMQDKPFTVDVNKLKVGGTEEVAGATIKIFNAADTTAVDANGKVLDESKALDGWQSAEGQKHNFGSVLQAGGTYWLVETGAPKGYGYSESIKFSVSKDGFVTVITANVDTTGDDASTLKTVENGIIMRDAVLAFKVRKTDLDAGDEVSGATIAIYDASDVSSTGTVNAGATPVVTWVSNGTTKDFGPELTAGKDYVLVETSAPTGYAYAANIPFRIEENGAVTVDASAKDDNGVVVVEDKALHVKFNKTDLVDGAEIDGAVISIFNKADVDADGNPTAAALKTWTSKPNEIVDFGDVVKAGQSYVLIETTVATDYQKAENIGFTVNRDGTLTIDSQYLDADGKIIMKDAPEGLELGQLTITKQIKGKVNEEELKGNLTFTLTDTATGTVVRSYKLNAFTYANGIYTLTITDLPAGKYVVEETTYMVDGKPCVVKYSVNSAPQKEGAKADEITVSALTPQTVAYENDYTNNSGKLVITKTIEGDVTKEEAEGALKFKVSKPDGTFAEYTLKDFDSYDAVTKTWTKTLDKLAEGNYTVEETVYTLDGKTVSVTYMVNGGTAQTGTKVTAGVAEDQTTKVDFKDAYTKLSSQLIITKTIKGDVTREEAEGALTFEVKEIATGKVTTYTLKDFTYDAATDKYTLVLNDVKGGYTVTETTKDIDGYTCKVTYQVDNGSGVKGDSASVTVAEGSAVTVAFENDYTEDAEDTTEATSEDTTEGTTEDSTADSKDKNPKTGDNTPLAACTMLMIAAAGMLPVAACCKKKKDENEE